MAIMFLGTLRALMLAAAAVSSPPQDQGAPQGPLPELTIEELLGVRVQPVFGASERLQPVTEAPASVTIVTAAEIQRYGYRTLGDILRAVRGFVVTNDRNYTYAGVRGLSLPGDYNSRLLLLVNGHRINDNIYDQAYLGDELNLDLGMVDRVEIIRGPSSSLYGTSAFFAVINIITRTGAEIDGGWIDGGIGTLGTGMVRLSYGRALENGTSFIVSGKHQTSDGVSRLFFDAFDSPGTNDGIAEHLDGERVSTLYGQVKWRDFALTVSTGRRVKAVPTASYYTIFNHKDPAQETTDARTMVHGAWQRAAGRTALTADLSFDHLKYSGIYPYEGISEGSDRAVTTNFDFATGTRLGAGLQVTRPLPWRQTLTAGVEGYAHLTQKQSNYYDDPALERWTSDVSSRQSAVYVDDEMRVRPWLLLNGGLRYDRYAQFSEITPRGGVIVMPSPNQSFKYLYGRAFRAPNAYELYYYADATAYLRPESIRTHELAWEQYVGEWLRTSVSAYRSTAFDLIALTAQDDADADFVFTNQGEMTARGLEVEAEVRTTSGVQAVGSAAFQRSVDERDAPLVNWPRAIMEARVSGPGPSASSTWSAEVHYVGERPSLLGTTVPSYTVANAAFSARVSNRWYLALSVRNLFDRKYFDPASPEHVQDVIEQNGRTMRLGLRWDFASARRAGR